MGSYDSIYADVKCPETGIKQNIEFQFKFGENMLKSYHVGDEMPLDFDPIGNFLLKEVYDCKICTQKNNPETPLYKVSYDNRIRHVALIHMVNKKITEVLNEEEFLSQYSKDGKILLPSQEIDYKSFE